MGDRFTETTAALEVSPATYQEIAEKLSRAGYSHCFSRSGELRMTGLSLVRAEAGASEECERHPEEGCGIPRRIG